MTQPVLQRVRMAGLELSLAIWNPDATQTLLMLHGYLDQKRSFDALAALLPSHWRCIAVDWRGHGESDRVTLGGSYLLLDHVRDLDTLWDVLALEKPVLVGHSMGANAAILLCGSGARTPRGLVLLESLGPPAAEAADAPTRLADGLRARRGVRRTRVLSSLEEGQARIRDTNPHLTPQGAVRLAAHSMRPLGDGTFTWCWDPALQGTPPFRYTEDAIHAFLRGLTMPVLVFHAEHGYLPSPAQHPERYACIPHATVVGLPGMGHHIHVDAPEALAKAMQPWLAGLE